MRTDWNLTVNVFYTRSSTLASISAKNIYAVDFVTEQTRSVGLETRTTNVFVGVDSSGLYPGQDVYWTLENGIYPNTKILDIKEGIDIISEQLLTIGMSTTRIYGVDTSLITTQTGIVQKANIIAPNTFVTSVGSTYIDISPASVNTNLVVGIATTTLSFYEYSGTYSVDLSARTTNSFFETLDLSFGVGTVVGIGSTYLDNANITYPSGAKLFEIGDFISPLNNIIGQGTTVIGFNINVGLGSTAGIGSTVGVGSTAPPPPPTVGVASTGQIYLSIAGINTVSISTVGVAFGYYGDAARVTTAVDAYDQIKRYSYSSYDSYTIQFLTKFPSAFVVDNTTAFPAYANPVGSENGDPSLRFIHGSDLSNAIWDINKVLGVKDYPTDHNKNEFMQQKGRRQYKGHLYPRHVFGR
jgi:hypothetical protein